MTAYTLAGYRNTTFNLTSADSLQMTHQGSIFVDAPNAAGILGASGNVLTLNGVVSSVQADAVLLSASNNSITVGSSAMLYGGDAGVSFAAGSNAIANSGTIIGGFHGVECAYGGNSIVNAGSILGRAGLRVGTDPASGTVVNTGEIRASRYDAVYADGAVSVTNSGVVDGATIGINTAGSTGASTIINSGYLYGRSFAAASVGGGADVIVNSGFMQGYDYAANLGNGSDFFDGRNGIQVGTVFGDVGNDVLYGGTSFDDLRGGAGNDQISGGASADYLDGGADFDLVRYDFATAAVTVNLASPAANTGEAAGDVLLNFEHYKFTDGTVDTHDGNPLIDDLFYYIANPDVWAAHMDADAHFAQFGWKEGRNPNAFFDTKAYLNAYADVKAAGVNPLAHYAQSGAAEGRDPGIGFDTDKYLAANHDVAAAHGNPLEHYLAFGLNEGRFTYGDGLFN